MKDWQKKVIDPVIADKWQNKGTVYIAQETLRSAQGDNYTDCHSDPHRSHVILNERSE